MDSAIQQRLEKLYSAHKRVQYKNLSDELKQELSEADFRKAWKTISDRKRAQVKRTNNRKAINRLTKNRKYECTSTDVYYVCRIADIEDISVYTFTKRQYIRYMKYVVAGMKSAATYNGIDSKSYMKTNFSCEKITSAKIINLKSIRYIVGVNYVPITYQDMQVKVRSNKFRYNPYEHL